MGAIEEPQSYVDLTVAGKNYRLVAIELLPEARVREWKERRNLAVQQLGTVAGTGIGFAGSPDWVVAGSLLTSAVASLLTTASQRAGLETLAQAQTLFDAFRWLGRWCRLRISIVWISPSRRHGAG